MRYWLVLAGVMTTSVLIATMSAPCQDQKAAKKRQVPKNWSKLGLSDEQKMKINSIQDHYDVIIAYLNNQLAEPTKRDGRVTAYLKGQLSEQGMKKRDDLAAVLTEDQTEQLKKFLNDQVPGGKPPKKKPVDK